MTKDKFVTRTGIDRDGIKWSITELESFSNPNAVADWENMIKQIYEQEIKFIMPDSNEAKKPAKRD